jgi:RNA polymerase primary sigma factor
LKQKLQRQATDEELAQSMDITVKKIRALKDIKSVVSLFSPLHNHQDGEEDMPEPSILDTHGQSPEEKIINKDIWPLARQVFVGVKNGERMFYVLTQRYDANTRTLKDIAKELKVSRERVRQIEDSALKRLKYHKIKKQFEQFR